MISDYNHTKGGVDSVDQMCSVYSTKRKTARWPFSFFFRILDIAGINSQVILRANKPFILLRRQKFLNNLVFSLLKDNLKVRSTLKNLPKNIYLFLEKYRPKPMEGKEPSTDKKAGSCHECNKHKNNKTTVQCAHCHNFICKVHALIE